MGSPAGGGLLERAPQGSRLAGSRRGSGLSRRHHPLPAGLVAASDASMCKASEGRGALEATTAKPCLPLPNARGSGGSGLPVFSNSTSSPPGRGMVNAAPHAWDMCALAWPLRPASRGMRPQLAIDVVNRAAGCLRAPHAQAECLGRADWARMPSTCPPPPPSHPGGGDRTASATVALVAFASKIATMPPKRVSKTSKKAAKEAAKAAEAARWACALSP
eukprot:scaffold2162_cov398-Prasinococcus_capsulatus_cf.AAC.1